MASLMRELGYDVEEDPREQQFSCDLQGGRDSKPSARIYPESNSSFCFACAKSRTPISLLMDKREISFSAAVSWIERWAHLPPLEDPGEDDDDDDFLGGSSQTEEPGDLVFQRKKTETLLRQVTTERAIEMSLTLRLWEAFDLVVHAEQGPSWKKAQLAAIETRIRKAQSTSSDIQ